MHRDVVLQLPNQLMKETQQNPLGEGYAAKTLVLVKTLCCWSSAIPNCHQHVRVTTTGSPLTRHSTHTRPRQYLGKNVRRLIYSFMRSACAYVFEFPWKEQTTKDVWECLLV